MDNLDSASFDTSSSVGPSSDVGPLGESASPSDQAGWSRAMSDAGLDQASTDDGGWGGTLGNDIGPDPARTDPWAYTNGEWADTQANQPSIANAWDAPQNVGGTSPIPGATSPTALDGKGTSASPSLIDQDAQAIRNGMDQARAAVGGDTASKDGSPVNQQFAANTPDGTSTDVSGRPLPDNDWIRSVARNPEQLVGKSAQEIADEFTAHGWPSTVEQSTQGSQRAQIVRPPPESPVGLVEVHPGGGQHDGAYTKVSTDRGTYKYVDPSTYERTAPEKASTKFFDARSGQPITQESLPIRGRGAPAAGTPTTSSPANSAPSSTGSARPLSEPTVPLESEVPGAVRPPLYQHHVGGAGPGPGRPPGPELEE